MKILIAASEAVPYIKTGGLGDVAGVLAVELARARHEVALVLPLHKAVDQTKFPMEIALECLIVKMGDADLFCRVWKRQIMKKFTVYFIEYAQFFYRHPIYDDGAKGYYDNGARFAFFSKACLDLALAVGFKPDVVQANDWQTALIPFYLKTWDFGSDFFKNTASLLSIHNIGYQGIVPADIHRFLGLQMWQFRESEFESFGTINLLKGSIFYADKVVTVSPTYAKEILGEPGGNGLSTYLQRRADDVTGILNGIDSKEWNPRTDKLIPANFTHEDLSGKALCKEALQKEFGLEVNPHKPIFGLVGRLAAQKGLDLLMQCVEEVLQWDLQMVLLGSGDPVLSDFFYHLPTRFPGKFASHIGFQPHMAHLIEAGSDFFVMPSRYEPCGLNQMYSLHYGTLPIVRGTGGLVDTVINYQPPLDLGTGFVFYDISANALRDTIGWALATYFNHPEDIKKMQVRGMLEDFTWGRAIKQYMVAYKEAVNRRKSWT